VLTGHVTSRCKAVRQGAIGMASISISVSSLTTSSFYRSADDCDSSGATVGMCLSSMAKRHMSPLVISRRVRSMGDYL
jgi:hypothetical protein